MDMTVNVIKKLKQDDFYIFIYDPRVFDHREFKNHGFGIIKSKHNPFIMNKSINNQLKYNSHFY